MKRPNPLAIGERVRDGRVHHKWMTRLLEENFGIKKQSGETLSLVNPISPYTYWGFMRKNGGERRHTRLSINPGDMFLNLKRGILPGIRSTG